MAYSTLKYDVEAGVATISLHRPDRLNAFTVEMMAELVSAFDEVDRDDNVRAVLVTGSGRAFCAGADLSARDKTFDYGDDPSGQMAPRDAGGILALRIFRSDKPVIAAINGPAIGVGATITLPMDVRLMSEGAKLGFVFGARGIVPDGASSWFLPRIVGISQALEWCLTSRVIEASDALAAGLVRSIHPADELIPAARALAEEIASTTAPISALITRQMFWRMLGARHPMEAHRVDSLAVAQTGKMADAVEGITAFLEKRPARWTLKPSLEVPDWHPWWEEPTYEC